MKFNVYLFIVGALFLVLGLSVSVQAAEIVDRIVAIVNEDIVTEYDINKDVMPYIKRINSSKYSIEQKTQLIKKIKEDILNKHIERALTAQEARRYGISVPDTEIDAIIENIKVQKSLTQESFERALIVEGYTIETFRENIRKQQLEAKIINFAVKEKTVITPSDIQAYYDANAALYAGQKKYYLRNIRLSDQDQVAVVKKQLAGNVSFEQLARQYSTAPNADQGGDLGLFDISDFSGPIKQSLLKLKKGEYSNAIETAQGFQIFYVQDVVVEGEKEYEQVSKEIEEKLYRERVEKQFNSWLETLKENAHIKKML
jgi:peptidyl-prolyl cis-trans isomerase SurA